MDNAVHHFALNVGWTPTAAVAALLAVLALGWVRERRGKLQRRTLQRFYKLGEQLTAGRSLPESLRLLQTVLPELMRVTGVHVYVPDRESKALQRLEVDTGSGLKGPALLTEESVEFLKQSVLLCYRNRSSIAVPDTRRSPLFDASQVERAPRSALFLPMFAQEDLLGVLAISDGKRLWHFNEEERALAQHLANQLAIGMKLLEQKSLQEHALGGDRLSAVHRLITSAAGELKEPLEHIAELSGRIAGGAGGDRGSNSAAELTDQVRTAGKALDRLLKLTRLDSDEESAIDVGSTLRALLKERQQAWREKGLEIQDLTGAEPLIVSSKGSALSQVLASLLWHMGERLERSTVKTARLRAFLLAAMVHVEFRWPPLEAESVDSDVFERPPDTGRTGVLGLRDCRDLVQSHGGQLRLVDHPNGKARLELEIPAKRSEAAAVVKQREDKRSSAPLTAIVMDPSPADQRALITALCDLGHRGVPVSSPEEAVELAGRMRFDVLFCSSSLPDTPWPECYERARHHVGSFVLLTPGRDAALSAALKQGGPRTLAKPVRLDELSQCLQEVGARSTVSEG